MEFTDGPQTWETGQDDVVEAPSLPEEQAAANSPQPTITSQELIRREAELAIIATIQTGDPVGREQAQVTLIRRYRQLIHGQARAMYRRLPKSGALGQDDLEQVGRLALIIAADAYDPTRNVSFVWYATRGVRQNTRFEYEARATAVRTPAWVKTTLAKVWTMPSQPNEPSLAQASIDQLLAEHAHVVPTLSQTNNREQPFTLGDLYRTRALSQQIGSINDSHETSGDSQSHYRNDDQSDMESAVVKDVSGNQAIRSFEDIVVGQQFIEHILGLLEEREALVVRLRLGLDTDSEPLPLREVSALTGLSYETVRRIETIALAKLRHPGRQDYFED